MAFYCLVSTDIYILKYTSKLSLNSTDNKFEDYQEKMEALEKDNLNHQETTQSLENVIKLHKNTIQYLNLQIMR